MSVDRVRVSAATRRAFRLTERSIWSEVVIFWEFQCSIDIVEAKLRSVRSAQGRFIEFLPNPINNENWRIECTLHKHELGNFTCFLFPLKEGQEGTRTF